MSRTMKIEIVRRLIRRGERFCAMVCCDDWRLDISKIEETM